MKPLKYKCDHKKRIIKVINTTATCETIVEVCMDCDKTLTKPITDCR